jgi:hypothetical protein
MDIHSEESNKFLGKQANPPNIRFFQWYKYKKKQAKP